MDVEDSDVTERKYGSHFWFEERFRGFRVHRPRGDGGVRVRPDEWSGIHTPMSVCLGKQD